MLMSQIYCFRLLLALGSCPCDVGITVYYVITHRFCRLSLWNWIQLTAVYFWVTWLTISHSPFSNCPHYTSFPPPPPARARSPRILQRRCFDHSWDECNLIISSTSWRQQLCKIWRQTKFNSYGQHENDECRKTPYSLMRRLRLPPNLTLIWKQVERRPLRPKKTRTGPLARFPSFPEALIRAQIL